MNKYIYVILIITALIILIFILNKKNINTQNVESKSIIKYVSMDEIVKIMNDNDNYIILDVRTVEEYNNGHIPNAINIPNETIEIKDNKDLNPHSVNPNYLKLTAAEESKKND